MREKSQATISVIRPGGESVAINFGELWQSRELFCFLIWRDIKIRYKQTVIGVAWSLLRPLGTMILFSVIMSIFARMPSDGLPYPVFFFTAILAWNYFSEAVSAGAQSLVGNAHLITKIHFPSLIVPFACLFPPLIDFCLSFLVLLMLMAWYHIGLRWELAFLPLFIMFTLVAALAMSVWLSALNVKYRDVGFALGFFIQIWFFASPIVYPVSVIPAKLRFIYELNPMYGVVEGFRWALLGKQRPDLLPILISAAIVLALLFSGLRYFRAVERTFADVI